ncbi:MAG TPA: tetratricopeptide repeat protein [Steroidobacteraceae bacterium]|jgi:predicted TPR repeat methyltransferase
MMNQAPGQRRPGRNDSCPCGSGAKYKRCCGRSGATEAVSAAAAAHRHYEAGRFWEAETLCQKVLALQPERADMLYVLGMIALKTGRNERAFDVLSTTTRSVPGHALAHNHLGVACLALKRGKEARECFLRSLALNPRQADVQSNLAIASKELGDFAGAESAYRTAIALDPRYAPAHYNLGAMLLFLDRVDEAVASLRQALVIRPLFPAARRKLAAALGCQGQVDAAFEMCQGAYVSEGASTNIYWQIANDLTMLNKMEESRAFLEKSLEVEPGHEAAAQLLAAFDGHNPQRLEAGYVKALFDEDAEIFESHLVKALHYDAPRELAALVEKLAGRPAPWDVLDLGCGTGLVGSYIAPRARQLVGVDLSPKMLEQAGRCKHYHRLECTDLLEFLQTSETTSYDIILAADVFIYVGRLDEVISHARRLLRPGGLFAFSVEAEAMDSATAEGGDAAGYRLNLRTRRFVHADEYLNALAVRNQFRVKAFERSRLRFEHEKPVIGHLVIWEA